jgi:hypothetical protein
MNASFEARINYLYVKIMGQYSNASAIEIFRRWWDEARNNKLYKVLCDLTQLIGLNADEAKKNGRFSAGELIALFLPKNISLAILAKPHQMEKYRAGEKLLRNRGIRIMVTHSLEEALKWLKVK